MRTYYTGIIVLALALLPGPATAWDAVIPVSSRSSSTLQSAPARSVNAPQPDAVGVKRAVFAGEPASRDVRHIADWVVDSRDNWGLPFVIVDKTDAKIFVFDGGGRLRGAAPALLGLARGDDSVPGIGDRELSSIRPEERTTPAGRFVAQRGMNFRGEDVVWVDPDTAVSLHRVITSNPSERRLERLASPTPADNRISYGCINVPAAFYNKVVDPSFTGTHGIVYVLPEIWPLRQVFGSYDVEERQRYAAQAPENPSVAEALPAAQ